MQGGVVMKLHWVHFKGTYDPCNKCCSCLVLVKLIGRECSGRHSRAYCRSFCAAVSRSGDSGPIPPPPQTIELSNNRRLPQQLRGAIWLLGPPCCDSERSAAAWRGLAAVSVPADPAEGPVVVRGEGWGRPETVKGGWAGLGWGVFMVVVLGCSGVECIALLCVLLWYLALLCCVYCD